LLVLGLLVSAVSLLRAPRPLDGAVVVERLFKYFLLFTVCIGNAYNFVMHVFFGDMTARFIYVDPDRRLRFAVAAAPLSPRTNAPRSAQHGSLKARAYIARSRTAKRRSG